MIILKKSTSSRVRFMLQDLIDLRKDQWKPRRAEAGPKTINQIHEEVEREKTQQKLDNISTGPRDRRGGDDMRGGGRGRPNKPSHVSFVPNLHIKEMFLTLLSKLDEPRKHPLSLDRSLIIRKHELIMCCYIQGGPPTAGDDGWTTMPQRPQKNVYEKVDMSKLKNFSSKVKVKKKIRHLSVSTRA